MWPVGLHINLYGGHTMSEIPIKGNQQYKDRLFIFEHQSSPSPNMPLRMLDYLVGLYDRYCAENGYNPLMYSRMPLPVPRFVVFSNWERERQDEMSEDSPIKGILMGNRTEVKGMIETEYDEKKVSELFFRDGKAEGHKDILKLNNILLKEKRYDDLERISQDEGYLNQLLNQYGLI